MMPTFAALAGAEPKAKLDGVSLQPLLLERQQLPSRPLMWMTGERTAYREGDWKLLIQGRTVELYDLKNDLGESKDLASTQLDRKQRMYEAALKLRAEIRGAKPMKTGS